MQGGRVEKTSDGALPSFRSRQKSPGPKKGQTENSVRLLLRFLDACLSPRASLFSARAAKTRERKQVSCACVCACIMHRRDFYAATIGCRRQAALLRRVGEAAGGALEGWAGPNRQNGRLQCTAPRTSERGTLSRPFITGSLLARRSRITRAR